MTRIDRLDEGTRRELEAEAFRTLVQHLRDHPEVQNIDLMNLAGFCRNCLSKYMLRAAEARDIELGYEEAREHVYGMPYEDWKSRHQREANAGQRAAYEARADR